MKHMNEDDEHRAAIESPAIAGLEALKRDRVPPGDLWPGIESRIQAQRMRRWRAPLWTSAAIAASLAVVLGLAVQRGDVSREAPRVAPAEVAAAQLVNNGDPRLVSVSNRAMHTETRAVVRANLKIVSSAEREIRQALERDPHGEYLKSLLAAAQDQKQELRVALASDDR